MFGEPMTLERRHLLLAEFAQRYSTTGKVVLAECRVCGLVDWLATYKDESPGFQLAPMHDCPRCFSVRARAPEVFQWVTAVVLKAETDRLEAAMPKVPGG